MGTLSLSLFLASYLSLSFSLSISTPDIPSRHLHFDFDFFLTFLLLELIDIPRRKEKKYFKKQIHVSWDQIKREGEEIPWHVYAWYFFHALLLLPFSSIAKSSNDSSLCNSKCIKKKRKETRYIRIISWKISISRKLNNYDSSKNPFSAI